jgi:hypothetical protein
MLDTPLGLSNVIEVKHLLIPKVEIKYYYFHSQAPTIYFKKVVKILMNELHLDPQIAMHFPSFYLTILHQVCG